MKLELKHLLDVYKYGHDIYGSSDIWKIKGLSNVTVRMYNGRHAIHVAIFDFSTDYSIVLRPLSDLTKEMDCPVVMGEKIIPLVELSKIAFFKNKTHKLADNYVDLGAGYSFHFYNDSDGVCFSCKRGYNGATWDYECFVPNQLELFQKLFEWHFDVSGLIDEGLAIDINTLK